MKINKVHGVQYNKLNILLKKLITRLIITQVIKIKRLQREQRNKVYCHCTRKPTLSALHCEIIKFSLSNTFYQ
jgi:hypothetical protein